MAEHAYGLQVDAPPDDVFAYLSDVANLPEVLPRLTEARRTREGDVEVSAKVDPDGEGQRSVHGRANFTVDTHTRSLRWSSEGEKDYGGQIEVSPDGETMSTVTVQLHWDHGDPDEVDAELEQTVQRIAAVMENRGR